MTGGAVNIPLKDGKSINIPVERLTFDPVTKKINITDEMSKTELYKQLDSNESNPDLARLVHSFVFLLHIVRYFSSCRLY